MINHLRTLLLNAAKNERQPFGYPGEELTPDDYAPVRLLPQMENMLHSLYGTRPDRAKKNLSLRRVLGMVEASELNFLLTRRDSRLSVPRWNDTKWTRPMWSTNADTQLIFLPDYVDGDAVYYQYILVSDGQQVVVYTSANIDPTPQNLSGGGTPPAPATFNMFPPMFFPSGFFPPNFFTPSGGVSGFSVASTTENNFFPRNFFPSGFWPEGFFPSSEASTVNPLGLTTLTLEGSGAVITIPNYAHEQSLEIIKKPSFSAGDLLEDWDHVDTDWLFGTDDFLRNIWTRREEAVYRVTAASVALAERIDDLRTRK